MQVLCVRQKSSFQILTPSQEPPTNITGICDLSGGRFDQRLYMTSWVSEDLIFSSSASYYVVPTWRSLTFWNYVITEQESISQ